jgi:hypothetical protein
MGRVQGVGGCLFAVSEQAPLNLPLVDADHGFDWEASDVSRSLWLEEGLRFLADEITQEPVGLAPLHGRVGFGRCLRGQHVRALGYHRPLSLVAESSWWEMNVPIGEVGSCVLTDWQMDEAPTGPVVVHLPSGGSAFRAFGRLLEPVADQPLRVVLEGEIRHGGTIS